MKIIPNALFQADCLSVLKRLATGEVMLAYIDPPFDTKLADFTIKDDRIGSDKHRQFLYEALSQIKRVLAESGNLFFRTDPRLGYEFRYVLDEIFGTDNFRTEFIIPLPVFAAGLKMPRLSHETIYLYSKSVFATYNVQLRSFTEEERRIRFAKSDDRGIYRLQDITSPIARPSLRFKWMGIIPPKGRSWRHTKEHLDKFNAEGKISFSNGAGLPKLKVYMHDDVGVEVGTIWNDLSAFPARGRRQDTAQNTLSVLERVVCMGSNPGDTVLDPFCGTGTTLIAAQANGRKWIGCAASHIPYSLSLRRLEETYGLRAGVDFAIGDQNFIENGFPILPDHVLPFASGGSVPTEQGPARLQGIIGLRVFLCHANADKPIVREMTEKLRAKGVMPWLDQESLVGGDYWEGEIHKAIQEADAVLVCLSRNFDNKSGYFQKELRQALSREEMEPEDSHFIIPIKLDDCQVPDKLKQFQWVNLDDKNGFQQLTKALARRSELLIARERSSS